MYVELDESRPGAEHYNALMLDANVPDDCGAPSATPCLFCCGFAAHPRLWKAQDDRHSSANAASAAPPPHVPPSAQRVPAMLSAEAHVAEITCQLSAPNSTSKRGRWKALALKPPSKVLVGRATAAPIDVWEGHAARMRLKQAHVDDIRRRSANSMKQIARDVGIGSQTFRRALQPDFVPRARSATERREDLHRNGAPVDVWEGHAARMRLNQAHVDDIRRRSAAGNSMKQIARDVGIGPQTVRRALQPDFVPRVRSTTERREDLHRNGAPVDVWEEHAARIRLNQIHVDDIRRRSAAGNSMKQIARDVGIGPQTVRRALQPDFVPRARSATERREDLHRNGASVDVWEGHAARMRLNQAHVDDIRRRSAAGNSMKQIARDVGIGPKIVRRALQPDFVSRARSATERREDLHGNGAPVDVWQGHAPWMRPN